MSYKCATVEKYTEEQYQKIRASVINVWQQIGADVLEYAPRIPNSHAIETCLDANRLLLNGDDKESDDLLYSLTSKASARLKRRLCKEVKL